MPVILVYLASFSSQVLLLPPVSISLALWLAMAVALVPSGPSVNAFVAACIDLSVGRSVGQSVSRCLLLHGPLSRGRGPARRPCLASPRPLRSVSASSTPALAGWLAGLHLELGLGLRPGRGLSLEVHPGVEGRVQGFRLGWGG